MSSTLILQLHDPPEYQAGIDSTVSGKDIPKVYYYRVDCRRLNAPQRSLNIKRMSDGTTRKVVVK